MKYKLSLLILFLLLIAAIFVVWRFRASDSTGEGHSDKNAEYSEGENKRKNGTVLPLGNPSNATDSTSNLNNFLLTDENFTVSFNRSRGIANWVAWTLKREDMGKVERQDNFRPDERLPLSWRITPSDFSYRGYSRGHLCPSADRTNSIETNSATFLMSNMHPQTHDLNTGPWEKLESYSRNLAWRGRELRIIAGGYGEIGVIKRKVSIPANNWKIIVILRRGDDIAKINQNTNIIAVDMPNVDGIKEDNWQKYKTTIRSIEQKTGLDFLSELPKDLQDVLETRVDNF